MGNEAGCKKADLKCGAVVKDSWIIRYSPKIDLYGVWKTENTDDLTDPDPTDPDPAGPDPTDPDPETPGTDREDPKPDSKDPDPVKPKDPDEDFPRGKIISFHCRFISKKYFEDAGRNLIPKKGEGLPEIRNGSWRILFVCGFDSCWHKNEGCKAALRIYGLFFGFLFGTGFLQRFRKPDVNPFDSVFFHPVNTEKNIIIC